MTDYAGQMNADWNREQKELADLEDRRQKFFDAEVLRIQEDPDEIETLMFDNFGRFKVLLSNFAKAEFDQDIAYEIHRELRQLVEQLADYSSQSIS